MVIMNDRYAYYRVYCGEMNGYTLYVTGKYVMLTFYSDDKREARGFLIYFTAVSSPRKCKECIILY